MGASEPTPAAATTATSPGASDRETLLRQLKVSSTWVNGMLASQLFLSIAVLSQTFFLYLIIHTFFVFIGMAGVIRQSRGFLFIHFVYSSALTFFLTIILCYCIMAGFPLAFYTLAFGIAYVLIQSVGMRHERALIVLIPIAQEMARSDIESAVVQPVTIATVPEEQQPFMMYDNQYQQQQPLSEEEEMQQIIAMIEVTEQQSQQQQQQQSQPQPAPVSTMPQYPFMYPPQHAGQQQHPMVFAPYQPMTGAEQQQQGPYYPMMYPGMPYPHPYMMPPAMFNNAPNKQ